MVRGVLEDSLSGRLDFLDGTVFPHTCDSIQRMSDIFRLNNQYSFFSDIILPVKLNTPSAKNYLFDVLTRFKRELETAFNVTITDASLLNSIKIYNTIKKRLSDIYTLQSQHPGILSGAQLSTIVRGVMVMDKDEAATLLLSIINHLEQLSPPENKNKRIILSGSVCDFPDIYTSIEDAGAVVVGDDLCTGQRWFDYLTNEDLPPMEALTNRFINRLPCPAKHHSIHARSHTLVNLAKKNKAHGVIFLLLKFCDPHAFDYPYLKDTLNEEGIKTLLIETDGQQQSIAQLSTRFETFIHML